MWSKMVKLLVFGFIACFLSSCGFSLDNIEPNRYGSDITLHYNNYFDIKTPKSSILHKREWMDLSHINKNNNNFLTPIILKREDSLMHKLFELELHNKRVKNATIATEDIVTFEIFDIELYQGSISAEKIKKFNELKFLTKSDIENITKKTLFHTKAYFDNMANLKCMVIFEKQPVKNTRIANRFSQDYFAICPFYHKDGFEYFIKLAFNLMPKNLDNTLAYKTFKKDLKEFLDNLVIYNVDIEKSKKAGMYVEKPYDINTEDKPIVEWINPKP